MANAAMSKVATPVTRLGPLIHLSQTPGKRTLTATANASLKIHSQKHSKRHSTDMVLSAPDLGRTNLPAVAAANATCLGPQISFGIPLKDVADAFLDSVLLRATPTPIINAKT